MAMSDARVREIISEMTSEMQSNIEQRIGKVLAENIDRASVLAEKLTVLGARVEAQVNDSDARITQNVVELNSTRATLQALYESCKNKFAELDMQRRWFETYSSQLTEAMNETSAKHNLDTDAKVKVLTGELNAYTASMESRLAAEFDSTKKFVREIEDRIRRTELPEVRTLEGTPGKRAS